MVMSVQQFLTFLEVQIWHGNKKNVSIKEQGGVANPVASTASLGNQITGNFH